MKGTDNIEKSYRDRFDTSSIQNEGWNEPRGIVWDKIEENLFDKKRNRYGFLPFLLVGFLTLTLFFTFYLYNQNLELKNVIHEVTVTNETAGDPEEHAATNNLDPSKEVEFSSMIAQKKAQNEVPKIPMGIDENIDSKNALLNNSIHSNNSTPREKLITTSSIEVNNEGLSSNGIVEVLEESKSKNVIFKNVTSESALDSQREIDKVSSLTLIDPKLDYIREHNFPKTIQVEKEKSVRRPYVSFLPNVAVGILQTRGLQETALSELIDKEYGNIGLGFDFLYTIPVRKSIDFSMGLGIESISFATEYDLTLPYMEENETVIGEKAFIDFEHSLPTAFGNTETALRLSRKRASDVLNESDVKLDFNTQHNFVSLALPLGLKYRFGSKKSFLSLGLSARPTYLLKANSSIQSVFSHHSGIDAINNESVSAYAEVRKWNVGLGVELGYNLFLTENSGVSFNLNLHDYLFDFYQLDDFSSTVKKAGLSIGYLHSF